MYAAARSLLFRLDAEHAHELTLDLFRRLPQLATLPFAHGHVQDPVELLGLRFSNRVGLAAGLDKNGECLAAWGRLGFGFVEIGTVTPRPQPGNPKPRMFRLPREQALINRLGFNNKGVDYLLQRVAENAQNPRGFRGVLGINIGKNFDTPIERAAEDYLICLRKVYRAASYVTVNISSPNTKNLRELQGEAALRELLQQLKHEAVGLARAHGKRTPILVKIAPDVSEDQLDAIARVVQESGIDGLIATNTTISRPLPADEPLAAETGGLSGAPLRPLAQATLQGLRQRLGADFPLIGVGGIDSAAAARERVAAGAQLIQVYTGFIYRGPTLVRECAQALKR